MRVYAAFVIFALVGCVLGVTTEEEEEQIGIECLELSGVDKSFIEKAEKGIIEDDPKFAEFLFCFHKKEGSVNDAGEYDPEVFRAETTKDLNSTLADIIVENCTKKKYSSGKEAAVELTKCYYKYAPKKE